MKFNCLSCAHALELCGSYEEYDGQIRCKKCGALLAIRTREGQIKWVELVSVALSGEDTPLRKTKLSHTP